VKEFSQWLPISRKRDTLIQDRTSFYARERMCTTTKPTKGGGKQREKEKATKRERELERERECVSVRDVKTSSLIIS